MRQHERQLEFAEESDPASRGRAGEAVLFTAGRWPPRSFRQNLKKLYAELEEPRGWGGREVAELREEKWEGARGPTKKTGKTEKDRLEAAKAPNGRDA